MLTKRPDNKTFFFATKYEEEEELLSFYKIRFPLPYEGGQNVIAKTTQKMMDFTCLAAE